MTIKLKHAAMFGLDARIALAIFGALSIISGATLYSAIQNAQVTSYIADLQEVNKGIEAYMLDTGSDLGALNSYSAKGEELSTSTKSNWRGPYTTLEFNSTVDGYKNRTPNSDSVIYIDKIQTGAVFGEGTNWISDAAFACSSTSSACEYWPRYNHMTLELANALEEKIDGAIDYQKGNVRVMEHAPDTNLYFVWLRGPRTLSEF